MTNDANTPHDTLPVTTAHVGRRARVIALRGPIRAQAVEQLREHLLSALDGGVRELFVDISEAESLTSPARELIASASYTLADRGGVLLVWSRKVTLGEATYVMAEVRDRALAELMPEPEPATRRGRP
ncbi:MAG: hypothetical protein M5U27_12670 [Gaiella sp.]|nr:hypothetical protein [Gaiella sp.]